MTNYNFALGMKHDELIGLLPNPG